MSDYELFNFTDPIEEAFETVIEAVVPEGAVQLPRSLTENPDVGMRILFSDGAATGHVHRVKMGEEPVEEQTVYDMFTGGLIEIDIWRLRYDAETIADNAPTGEPDTTARDLLSHYAARVRYALRRTDAKQLNAALTSPKITHIRPLGSTRVTDEDMGIDHIILRYELNYGIPATIWPSVLLTESGFYIKTEAGVKISVE